MRTTIDISDELMKKAKIHAVKEGITLKELFTRLLEKEVGELSEKAQKARKIKEMAEQLRTGDKKLDAEIEIMTEKMWKRLEG
jgi:cell division protein YceG involved in septum cleavage